MNAAASSTAILEAIQQVVGPSSSGQPVALHESDFRSTQAWAYVKDFLDTGWVSTAGRWVSRFEQELAYATGAAHAVAVTNGTVALRLALNLAGVGPGDEVLLPPLSFVATANAVVHLGAVPHFVDVEPTTLAMDPAALAMRLEQLAERRDGHLLNRQTGRRLAAAAPCSPTKLSWLSGRGTFQPPPSCLTPGRLNTMPWAGTTASPTSMPLWVWPNWRTWSGAWMPSASWPSAIGPPWLAWRK